MTGDEQICGFTDLTFIEKLQSLEDGKTVGGNIPVPHGPGSLWIQARDMLKPSVFFWVGCIKISLDGQRPSSVFQIRNGLLTTCRTRNSIRWRIRLKFNIHGPCDGTNLLSSVGLSFLLCTKRRWCQWSLKNHSTSVLHPPPSYSTWLDAIGLWQWAVPWQSLQAQHPGWRGE